MIYLHFPVNYIAEYIPPNRQGLFWGNKVYREVDGRKYRLRENLNDIQVQIPFYNRDDNIERLRNAIKNNEFIYFLKTSSNSESYPFYGWKR